MSEPENTEISKSISDRTYKKVSRFSISDVVARVVSDRILLLILLNVVLAGWMTISYPRNFPTGSNLAAVLLDTAQGGILTVGMMILLIAGVFDLSIGATLAFTGIVAGTLVKDLGWPPLLAFLGGIAVGSACGMINGFVVTKLRINALITTLAMMNILRGATQLVAPTGVINLPEDFREYGQFVVLGLQSPFWFMIGVAALGMFLMSKTRFFRQFYYTGSNSRAAVLSGIVVNRVLFVGFVLMGTLAGLAGTLFAARLGNAVLLAGTGVELKAITAAILGGASLFGGVGKIPGAFLGVIFMSLIQNALIIARVPVFWQSIVVGLTLLFAVGIDEFGRRRR